MTSLGWEIVVILEAIAIMWLGLGYRRTRSDYFRLAELLLAWAETESLKAKTRAEQKENHPQE